MRGLMRPLLMMMSFSVCSVVLGAELGDLSAIYESSGKGPGTVSSGKGDPGGVSYGSYQLSTTRGRADEFVQKYYPKEFKDLKAGTPEFTKVWKDLAKKSPADLHAKEHAYIKATHYDVQAAKLLKEVKLDVSKRSATLRDVVWSTAVVPGPNTGTITKALGPLLKGKTIDELTDEEIIDAVYAERFRERKDGKLAYWPSANEEWTKGLKSRGVNEKKAAQDMLKAERAAAAKDKEKTPTPTPTPTPGTGTGSGSGGFLDRFQETYFEISANGKKISEAKSAEEAEKVAAGARNLYGDASIAGPLKRFTVESVINGITGLIRDVLGDPASPTTPSPTTQTSPAKDPPKKETPPKKEPPKKDPAPPTQKTKSGKSWYSQFPGSTAIADLEDDFEGKVTAFRSALSSAGASTTVNATLRPPERAYMMHWAWKIVNENADASKIPAKDGVNIEWWHGNQADSKKAAQEMVDAYGLRNLKTAPALSSRHIQGKAIDMEVSWTGDLKIKNKDGTEVTITSTPRNHTNPDLIKVAATYGVIHFTPVAKDAIHWSTDGR